MKSKIVNNGLDTDGNGICNIGDQDDDNDTVLDTTDNCPLDQNLDQLDSEQNGVGDVCEVEELDQGFCFPIISASGRAAVVCL